MRTGPDRKNSNAGFSIIEALLALTVFVIGIGAITSSLVASRALGSSTQNTSVAVEAAQSMIERVKGETFAEAFVRFNATDGDDPDINSPGSLFAVDGLDLVEGDADGFVGEVIFPGDGIELREDFVDADLGMPRDLNGDGGIDAADHSGDYIILPVRVRLGWNGSSGARSIEFTTVLVDK